MISLNYTGDFFSSKKLILVVPGDLPNGYGSFKDNGAEGPQNSALCQHILFQNLSYCHANVQDGPVMHRSLLSGYQVYRDNVIEGKRSAKVSKMSRNPAELN